MPPPVRPKGSRTHEAVYEIGIYRYKCRRCGSIRDDLKMLRHTKPLLHWELNGQPQPWCVGAKDGKET